MLKNCSVKAVAVALFALVFSHAYDARAGEDVQGDVFTTGVSFENYGLGDFNPRLSDEGKEDGFFHWYAVRTNDLGQVSAYGAGNGPYDYAAHGLARRALLEEREPTQARYLTLNSEQGLDRAIFSRTDALDTDFTNVLIRTGSRESIYCDMLVKFTAGAVTPEKDTTTRLAVWARTLETDGGEIVTNLMVTAGYFANGFAVVTPRDYRLDFDVDLTRWYRLTVRAHGDVSASGVGIAGFSVYIDGEPVRGVAGDYSVFDPSKARASWLAAEARALMADRRLFVGMTAPGSDMSFTLSRFNFTGNGQLDDITFSSEDPGYAKPVKVFTLTWDAGVTLLKYTLDGGVTTNTAPVSPTVRSCEIDLGPAPAADLVLTVTDVEYDTAHQYGPGAWYASNGATLVDGTNFVYDGVSPNPIANVVSTLPVMTIGIGGTYDSFTAAFAAIDRSGSSTNTIQLVSDYTIGPADGYTANANNLEGRYVLDLAGHTLRGGARSRKPTVQVSCRSFTIRDSSAEKTGRILPVESITNASANLNTAVNVYPSSKDAYGFLVQPELTVEGGIFDGWIRNDGKSHQGVSIKGTVIVEDGFFASTNSSEFYLASGVTNEMAYFAYRGGYWSQLSTNMVVWTGTGDGRSWSDPLNWKSGAVPTPGNVALFPSRVGSWTVDAGVNGMTTKELWLEGDVMLSGTDLDFVGVENVGATNGALGRISGDATLVFRNTQPGKLTETLLSPTAWAGLVRLEDIPVTSVPRKSPVVLSNLETWGTARSSVEFHGVRGYVMDVASHTMSYQLILRDYVYRDAGGNMVTNYAWQNDSGYTGSTLAFKNALLGDGAFYSPANPRPVAQVIKFADVSGFEGRFNVSGKRVLLGGDSVSSTSVGLLAFADHAVVPSGLGWTCSRALFGSALNILGETNDVLVTCSATVKPDVTCCTNTTLNGIANIAWLACTDAKPWQVYVTGDRPSYIPAPAPEQEGGYVPPALLTALSVAADDTSFSATALRSAALVMASAAVNMADLSIEIGETTVTVGVSNASPGLWYGLRFRPTLAADWEDPEPWVQATGSTVTLTAEKRAESGFYGVVVSCEDPRGGGGD